jgi:hypothetical protein
MKRLALLLALGAAAAPAAASRLAGSVVGGTEMRPLPFISDDYPRALAEARARGLPLFVEAWAPW